MTKAALLLVVGEAFDEAQKTLILDRIVEELSGWDEVSSGCNLQKELENLVAAKSGSIPDTDFGAVVTHETENLSTTILFNPERKQLLEHLQNFLLVDSSYRHLVYSGLTLAGSGNWILRDDVFTFRDFVRVLKDMDSVGAKGEGKDFSLTLGLAFEWDWSRNNLSKLSSLGVKLSNENVEKRRDFDCFRDYLSHLTAVTNLNDLLKTSNTVGTINFSAPTLYIFPGGNGNSSLFGVRGFTALVDGGYGRKPCFWDFSRHIQQIDMMLLTHLGVNNILGMQSFLERKMETGLPDVGSVFFNCPEKFRKSPNPNGLKLNLFQSGATFAETLNAAGLPPQSCYSLQPTHPITLYNKVGFGSVDMYVLNPIQNTEEMKAFLHKWSLLSESDGFSSNSGVPVGNSLSVSVLLVWKPFAPKGKIVRILFPGGSPQSKIFEGLDRLKNMALFERANCFQVELNEKSQNVGGKPGKTPQVRPVSVKSLASFKVSGDEDITKSKLVNKNPVAAKAKFEAKEPAHAKNASALRSTKVDTKLPEKDVANSKSATNIESKSSSKTTPQKSMKDVPSKLADNSASTKKPVSKPSDIELTPKGRVSKQSEAGKQTKPAKRPEVLESRTPTPTAKPKENKGVAKPEASKQTKTAETTKPRSVVKQTKAAKISEEKTTSKHLEANKEERQKESEKQDPEKQVKTPDEASTIQSTIEAEKQHCIESIIVREPAAVLDDSDVLPDHSGAPELSDVGSAITVVKDAVFEGDALPRVGRDYDIPSPEDVAQMSQEEEDSCVEELPTETELYFTGSDADRECHGNVKLDEQVVRCNIEENAFVDQHEVVKDIDVDHGNDRTVESESVRADEIIEEQENDLENEMHLKDGNVLSKENEVYDDQNAVVPEEKFEENPHFTQRLDDDDDFENDEVEEDIETVEIMQDQHELLDHEKLRDHEPTGCHENVRIADDRQDLCDYETMQDPDHEREENEEISDQDHKSLIDKSYDKNFLVHDNEAHDDNQEIEDRDYCKNLPEGFDVENAEQKTENSNYSKNQETSHDAEQNNEFENEKSEILECENELQNNRMECKGKDLKVEESDQLEKIDDVSSSDEDSAIHGFEKEVEDDDEKDDLDAVPEEEEVEEEDVEEDDWNFHRPVNELLSTECSTKSAICETPEEEDDGDEDNINFATGDAKTSAFDDLMFCSLKKDEACENLAALCIESKEVVSSSGEIVSGSGEIVSGSGEIVLGSGDAPPMPGKEMAATDLDLVAPFGDVLIKSSAANAFEVKESTEMHHAEPNCMDHIDTPYPFLQQDIWAGFAQRQLESVRTTGEVNNTQKFDDNFDHGDTKLEIHDKSNYNLNSDKDLFIGDAAVGVNEEMPGGSARCNQREKESVCQKAFEVDTISESGTDGRSDECLTAGGVFEDEAVVTPGRHEEVKDLLSSMVEEVANDDKTSVGFSNGNLNLGFDDSGNLSVEIGEMGEASTGIKSVVLSEEKSAEGSGESDLEVDQKRVDPHQMEKFCEGKEEDYKMGKGFEDDPSADWLCLESQQEPEVQSVSAVCLNQGLFAKSESESRYDGISFDGQKNNLNPFFDPDFNGCKVQSDNQVTKSTSSDKEGENESIPENSDADELNEFVRYEMSTEAALALISSKDNDGVDKELPEYGQTSDFSDDDDDDYDHLVKPETTASRLEQQSPHDSRLAPFWTCDNTQSQEIVTDTGAADNAVFGEETNDIEKDINENLDVSNSTDSANSTEFALTQSNISEEIQLCSAALDDSASLDSDDEVDPVKNWGQPMGLPAPTQDGNRSRLKTKPAEDAANLSLPAVVGDRSLTATQKKTNEARRSATPKLVAAARMESKESASLTKESKTAANKKQVATTATSKAKKPTTVASAEAISKSKPLKHVVPFYVDLTYIPGNGEPSFVDADFFRRVRARYYVLSALEPDPRVLSCLVEGKQTWENKDASVEVIPTYDSDALHRWRHENRKLLEDLKIAILPSASKCTIKLEADNDDGCCAFRVEF